jgi:FtsP/CotA-like multicopper oxidase with cupredoxin domain
MPVTISIQSISIAIVLSLAGKPTAGILKDVVMLGGYQEAEVDFIADNPGLTLFHCHQQLHMDYGFMTLFDYAA